MTAVPPFAAVPDEAVLPDRRQPPAPGPSASAPSPATSILPRCLNLDLLCRCGDDFIGASPLPGQPSAGHTQDKLTTDERGGPPAWCPRSRAVSSGAALTPHGSRTARLLPSAH